jgi:hypothetical protein
MYVKHEFDGGVRGRIADRRRAFAESLSWF